MTPLGRSQTLNGHQSIIVRDSEWPFQMRRFVPKPASIFFKIELPLTVLA